MEMTSVFAKSPPGLDAQAYELRVAELLERASALFRLAEALEDKKSRSILFEAAFEFERLAQRMATVH